MNGSLLLLGRLIKFTLVDVFSVFFQKGKLDSGGFNFL